MNPPQPSYTQSRPLETTSENYTTGNVRLRKHPTKDYRIFMPQTKILASRTTPFYYTHLPPLSHMKKSFLALFSRTQFSIVPRINHK